MTMIDKYPCHGVIGRSASLVILHNLEMVTLALLLVHFHVNHSYNDIGGFNLVLAPFQVYFITTHFSLQFITVKFQVLCMRLTGPQIIGWEDLCFFAEKHLTEVWWRTQPHLWQENHASLKYLWPQWWRTQPQRWLTKVSGLNDGGGCKQLLRGRNIWTSPKSRLSHLLSFTLSFAQVVVNKLQLHHRDQH